PLDQGNGSDGQGVTLVRAVPSSQACYSCDSPSVSTIIIFLILFNNLSGTVVAGVLRLCNTVFWVLLKNSVEHSYACASTYECL
ncbi:hypothetical protein A2U01_0030023, partial [Trifolium medium]|nr:hypothetical protein [Trifolium medium]